MEDKINKRFDEVVKEGEELVRRLQRSHLGTLDASEEDLPVYQSWFMSAANLLHIATRVGSPYRQECERLVTHGQNTIPAHDIQKMLGLTKSARDEWHKGLLQEIEYVIFAEKLR